MKGGGQVVKYIGFTCTTIFHYIHLKNIAEHFGKQAIFIISTPRYTNNRYEKLENYFIKHGVVYCDSDAVIKGQIELETIVAPYFLPLFSFIDSKIYRVRVLYGYAKDAWNYADWNKGFDLILAYGPYSQRHLEQKAPTVSIGHPRFTEKSEQWSESVYNINGLSLAQWQVQSDKEILLYCPTWGDLSSFDWFKSAINELSPSYNIIVKLHHLIALSKDFDLSHLDNNNIFVCDETVDLFDLFPISNVVISDYSGAIFDAMLANNRIVLVNSLSETIADTGILNIKKMSNVADLKDNNINQDGSLDIQMRTFLPSANYPSELLLLVGKVIEEPVLDYSKVNADLYAFQDGQASNRAYLEINKLIHSGASSSRAPLTESINYNHQVLHEFVESNRSHSFVVWGAGDYGQLIISWLKNNQIKVKAILDTDTNKDGKYLYDIPIFSPNNYKLREDERLVVSFISQNKESTNNIVQSKISVTDGEYIIPFN